MESTSDWKGFPSFKVVDETVGLNCVFSKVLRKGIFLFCTSPECLEMNGVPDWNEWAVSKTRHAKMAFLDKFILANFAFGDDEDDLILFRFYSDSSKYDRRQIT